MTEAFYDTLLVSGCLDVFLIPAGGEPEWTQRLEIKWVNASDENKTPTPRVLENLRISFHLHAYQMANP